MSQLTASVASIQPAPISGGMDAPANCGGPISIDSSVPSAQLPQSNILPQKYQDYFDKCSSPCGAGIRSALIDVATVLQSLDAHLASYFGPALNTIAQVKGQCVGCCNCCYDECIAILAKCQDKVRAHCYGQLSQAAQYAAMLGITPGAADYPSSENVSPAESGQGAPTASTAVELLPTTPTAPAGVNLLPTNPVQPPALLPNQPWAQQLQKAIEPCCPAGQAGAWAAAIAQAIAAATAQANAMTRVSQTVQGQLLAQVQGGSIVISPQQSPIVLNVQCITDTLIQQLFQVLSQTVIQVQQNPPKRGVEWQTPTNDDGTPTGESPERVIRVPVKQPAFSGPAGLYEVEVPDDVL